MMAQKRKDAEPRFRVPSGMPQGSVSPSDMRPIPLRPEKFVPALRLNNGAPMEGFRDRERDFPFVHNRPETMSNRLVRTWPVPGSDRRARLSVTPWLNRPSTRRTKPTETLRSSRNRKRS